MANLRVLLVDDDEVVLAHLSDARTKLVAAVELAAKLRGKFT